MKNFRLIQQYLFLRTKHDQLVLKREYGSIFSEFIKSNSYTFNENSY